MYSNILSGKQQLIAVLAILSQAASISASPLINTNLLGPLLSSGPSFDKQYNFRAVAPKNPSAWFGPDVEGLSVDNKGFFYANNFGEANTRPHNTIGRIDPSTDAATLFYTDPDSTTYITGTRFYKPFNAQNGLLMTDIANHRVISLTWNTPDTPLSLRVGENGNAERRVLCQNPKMIQPNDLAVAARGRHIYLTGLRGTNEAGEGDLWLCSESGEMTQLEHMGRTNGIALSAHQDYLYVSEAVGGWKPSTNRIWRYKLDLITGKPEGQKELFFDFDAFDKSGATDINGIRIDAEGSLYVTRMGVGEIIKLSRDGKVISRIKTLKKVADIEFGGPGARSMYAIGPCESKPNEFSTAGCVEKTSAPVSGLSWTQLQ
ncbi:hypothetical protein BDF19DRAFT_429023 [Syncephalis fuscata]|nr:hypothetical protein BDF19DRAFT_429023 [Syncephalis fuscata]